MIKQDAKQTAESIVGPHSLERYAPLFIVIQGLLFIVGCIFWIDASQGASAFSPTTWGRWAWDLSAEFWAALNMGASAICLIGLINPIHRKMVILGGSLHMLQHIGLSFSAFFTGGDVAIGLYASVFFLTLHMVMTAGAIAEWKR